jgi:hypothetical protein
VSHSDKTCEKQNKVLWFTAIDSSYEYIREEYYRFLVAALNSARINAPSLVPYVLYSGNERDIPISLKSMEWVNFVYHKLTFIENMKKYNEKYHYYIGAYYRIDIPVVMESLYKNFNRNDFDMQYVLYTDADVLFYNDFNSCALIKPPVISIGPEYYKNTSGNSGVLYMNVSAMKEHHKRLIAYADSKSWNFDSLDQGLILNYFVRNGLSNKLPNEYNWKGYWGGIEDKNIEKKDIENKNIEKKDIENKNIEKKDIVIVHFHGPKPGRCLDCFLTFRHFKNYCKNCSNYEFLFQSTVDHGKFYEKLLIDFYKYSS